MASDPVFIGIGGNLTSPRLGPPLQVCRAAVDALAADGFNIVARSRWYRSEPVPPSDQPDYVNGVVQIRTELAPDAILARLKAIERDFGRVAAPRNAARVLDLDLLACGALVSTPGADVTVPHPALHHRAFVLVPLCDIDGDWRHPVLGLSAAALRDRLPPGQRVEPLDA